MDFLSHGKSRYKRWPQACFVQLHVQLDVDLSTRLGFFGALWILRSFDTQRNQPETEELCRGKRQTGSLGRKPLWNAQRRVCHEIAQVHQSRYLWILCE